jgi:phosphoribosyl 1,2-cyclic phosphate phosphodiesterase
MISCKCEVCTSENPKNVRLRSSGLLSIKGKRFLIDIGPDFRMQALRYQISSLAGVMITHAHSDHIAGIDDLRAYYLMQNKEIPCLLSKATADELQMRFPYLWKEKEKGKSLPAQLNFFVLENDSGTILFEGVPVRFFTYYQKEMKVTGYRINNFAYVSDIRDYSQEIFAFLEGVEILVLSALRHEPSSMHFTIEEAIAFSRMVRAKTTYFTHIAHEIEHESVSRSLPPSIFLAYDGLSLEFQ